MDLPIDKRRSNTSLNGASKHVGNGVSAFKDESRIDFAHTPGLNLRRVDTSRTTEPVFTFCQNKTRIDESALGINSQTVNINILDLIDCATRILRSSWAAELSPEQGGLHLKLLDEHTPPEQASIYHAGLEGIRLARHLRTLPPEQRSFLAEGQSVHYGDFEFYCTDKDTQSWSVKLNADFPKFEIPARVLIDFSSRVLRDPFVASIAPLRHIEYLGAYPNEVWSSDGEFLISWAKDAPALDSQVSELDVSGVCLATQNFSSEKDGLDRIDYLRYFSDDLLDALEHKTASPEGDDPAIAADLEILRRIKQTYSLERKKHFSPYQVILAAANIEIVEQERVVSERIEQFISSRAASVEQDHNALIATCKEDQETQQKVVSDLLKETLNLKQDRSVLKTQISSKEKRIKELDMEIQDKENWLAMLSEEGHKVAPTASLVTLSEVKHQVGDPIEILAKLKANPATDETSSKS
jgi:hypothetical protein